MQQATETAPTVQPPVAAPAQPGELSKDTYKGKIHPDWCPGCGDFSVLSALQTALFELGLKPHQVAVVSGIGGSSAVAVGDTSKMSRFCSENVIVGRLEPEVNML